MNSSGVTAQPYQAGKMFEKDKKQAGAELGQAQLQTGIWMYCD